MKPVFPHLEDLLKTYFHQDYDLIADDLEGLMQHFVSTADRVNRDATRAEIEEYLRVHAKDLDQAFQREYGEDLNPQAWGFSTEAFLRKVANLIA